MDEAFEGIVAYYGTHAELAYREGVGVFRPTNLYHFREILLAALQKKIFRPDLPFFDAGFGDGRVLAVASLIFPRALGLEADEELAEQGLAHLDRLADLDLLDRQKIRAIHGNFLNAQDFERRLRIDPSDIFQFFNYYDHAYDLLELLAQAAKPHAKLLLYTGILVPQHDAFFQETIWEGDNFQAVVFHRKS